MRPGAGSVVMCHDSVDEANDDIDVSVACGKDSVEHSVGEPEAFAVDVDESSMYRATVETCTHGGTASKVSHRFDVLVMALVGHTEFGTMLATVGRTVAVTGLGYAGHQHGQCGDC